FRTVRKYTSCGLDPHHCGASSGVLDRRFTLKAGFSPMIDVAFAGDIVGSHTVMRQADDAFLPTPSPQLAGIPSERPSQPLDILQQHDFAADELADPDRHGVRAMARAANVHERFDRQYRINRDLPDPALGPQ